MGIIVIGMLVVGWWVFIPDNVVVITSPVVTDKIIYDNGDRISYTFSYCKTRKLPGEVVRSLVNSVRITFTNVTSDLPVGCHTIKVSDLVIPDYADPGEYHLEGSGVYKVNPMMEYQNNWQSNSFQIKFKNVI